MQGEERFRLYFAHFDTKEAQTIGLTPKSGHDIDVVLPLQEEADEKKSVQ
jgi:hypothetical protein